VVGEIIGDAQTNAIQGRVKARVEALEAQGVEVTPETRYAIALDEGRTTIQAANLASAFVALSTGKDPNIAADAAQTAIENNSLFGMTNHVYEKKVYAEEDILKDLKSQRNKDLSPDQQQDLEQKIVRQEKVVQDAKTLLMMERKGQTDSVAFVADVADKASDVASGGTATVVKQVLKKGFKEAVKGAKKLLTSAVKKSAKKGTGAPPKQLSKPGTPPSHVSKKVDVTPQKPDKVGGIEVKPGEQPWTVRPGQEYKKKIIGRAQKTGSKSNPDTGHAVKTYRHAIKEAKKPDTEAVLLNRGYNRVPGVKIKSNRRPDAIVVKKDGKVNPHEVASRTDRRRDLRSRNKEAIDKLPKKMRGQYTDVPYKGKK